MTAIAWGPPTVFFSGCWVNRDAPRPSINGNWVAVWSPTTNPRRAGASPGQPCCLGACWPAIVQRGCRNRPTKPSRAPVFFGDWAEGSGGMERTATRFACFHLACSSAAQRVPGSLHFMSWARASCAKRRETIPVRRPVSASSAFRSGPLTRLHRSTDNDSIREPYWSVPRLWWFGLGRFISKFWFNVVQVSPLQMHPVLMPARDRVTGPAQFLCQVLLHLGWSLVGNRVRVLVK